MSALRTQADIATEQQLSCEYKVAVSILNWVTRWKRWKRLNMPHVFILFDI